MGKLRAKDSRAKKINDFKKVKAKVGRHAKRGPVTVIQVKTKRIVMPHQQSILHEPISDESARITVMLRQFHHHSSGSRSAALDDLAELLSNSPIASAHIVLPTTLELLYDSEVDIRQSLLKLLSGILNKHSVPAVYQSIAPVIVTYACSGLTSLDKGIRKDALQLLLLFLDQEAGEIFTPFASKILHHMLTVLVESSRLTGSLQRLTSTASVVSSMTSTAPGSSVSAGPGSSSAGNSSAAFLLMSLRVVAALLALLTTGDMPGHTVGDRASREWQHSAATLPAWSPGGASVLFRPALRRESVLSNTLIGPAIPSSDPSGTVASGEVADSYASLFPTLISHLSSVWNGLTLQSDSIRSASSVLPPLQSIARAALSLCVIFNQHGPGKLNSLTGTSPTATTEAFEKLLSLTFFAYFPYTSVDASIAVQGSVEEVFARKHLEMLNTTLCEVALRWKHHSDRNLDRSVAGDGTGGDYGQIALDFVSCALKRLNERMSQHQPAGGVGVSEVTYCLLRCVSLQGQRGIAGLDSVLVQLGHLLRTQLRTISRAVTVSAGGKVGGGVGEGKKRRASSGAKAVLVPVTTLLAAVRCVSDITHTDFLWDFALCSDQSNPASGAARGRADSLAFIADVMSQIPAELVAAVSRGGNDGEALRIAVNDVLTLCAEVLLLLMRRVSLWGPEDGEVYKTEIGTAGWVSQVLSVMDRVEHLFIPQDTGEGCVYLHSSREVRRQWNDLWFHCPFGTGTARSAASVMECVCGADVGADERAYFLNLLFERRAMMSPGAFVDLVMTGVEVYLEQLEGVYEDWIIDVNTEPSGDTVVEDDESVLVRFSDEYLWPSAGNLEREDGGRRRYLGGFLSQATHILIAGSSYPHSAGLLRLVGPRLMTLLLPSDEDDSEEGHETADNMGVTTLLRVALVTTFTGELLSYWPKDFPSGSGNAGGTDTTALTTSVRELINMAAVDVCKFVSDNHSHSVSAAATRVGLQQLSEGVKQNVVEPVLALLCAEWRLPDGTDVWFFGEVLEEIGRTVVMAGDCKASTQSLSAVYDIVRYFDSLEILDYSRRQAVIAITRRVYSNSKSESIRELLTGIEQYLTSR